ncbi:MAG: prepilin peptidase [Pseudomonadota bacterium]
MSQLHLFIVLAAIVTYSGFLIIAAIGDAKSFTITNRLNVAFAISFLVFALPLGLTFKDIGIHILAATIAFGVGFLLFAAGLFGGGDAKLMAATAIWLGPAPMLSYGVNTALAGGLLAIVLIAARFLAAKIGLPKKPKWLRRLMRKTNHVPYGIALCVGGLFALPRATWFELIKLF